VPPSRNTQILLAVIGTISAVGVAAIGIVPALLRKDAPPDDRSPLLVTITVFDPANVGVEGARTILTMGSSVQESATDSFGRHTFEIQRELKGRVATISVSQAGFLPRKIEVAVSHPEESREIHLARQEVHLATAAPTPSTTPPPNSHPTVQPVTDTFRSGPKPSGIGKDFSDWYDFCSPVFSPGTHVLAVSYRLEGDRQCGAWSDCGISQQTDTQVCMRFRLQGHDEVFPPRPFFSEAFLKVTYQPPA